jgi:hypothetical protein
MGNGRISLKISAAHSLIGPLAAKNWGKSFTAAFHRQLIESVFIEFHSLQKVISHHRRLS